MCVNQDGIAFAIFNPHDLCVSLLSSQNIWGDGDNMNVLVENCKDSLFVQYCEWIAIGPVSDCGDWFC